MRFLFIFSVLSFFIFGVDRAWADCTSPAAVAGTMDYSGAPDNVFKYCNGSEWVPMGMPMCTAGKSLVMGQSEWECCPMLAETWQEPAEMPSEATLPALYDIAYGGGVFVAVGTTSALALRSVDGQHWTSHAIPEQGMWEGVAYGNGVFVAVRRQGTGGVMVSSDGGQTWALGDAAADAQWVSIAYGKGLFVAVARQKANPAVMTSPDGLTWTMRATPSFRNWNKIVFLDTDIGGMFVATSHNNTGVNVMTSEDGITWVGESVLGQAWRGASYGNGMLVISGGSPTGDLYNIATRAVGDSSWTPRTAPNGYWKGVHYGNGLFVAINEGSSGNLITSKDGINWQMEAGIGQQWRSLAYAQNMFVAVGGSTPKVMVSSVKYCP